MILGAGASIASNLRDSEIHGLQLPSMNNLPDVVGLNRVLSKFSQELIYDNFEATYSNIAERDPPISDVEANAMMKQAWGNIDDRDLEQFEIIDVRKEEEVRESWSEFIHTHHYDSLPTFLNLL